MSLSVGGGKELLLRVLLLSDFLSSLFRWSSFLYFLWLCLRGGLLGDLCFALKIVLTTTSFDDFVMLFTHSVLLSWSSDSEVSSFCLPISRNSILVGRELL